MAKKPQSRPAKTGQQRNYSKPGKGRGRSNKFTEESVPDSEINVADLAPMISRKGEVSKGNDYSWNMHYPELAQDFASIPFSYPLGLSFDFLTHKSVSNNGTNDHWILNLDQMQNGANTVPGILACDFVPVVGVCDKPGDGPNVAAQQLFTMVRSKNSGRVNYDKTDLMMYMMAMDSAFIAYEIVARAYGLFRLYDTNNRYFPEVALRSLGFAPQLVKNIKDIKGMLDVYATRLAAIPFPDQFDFQRRHSWMCSGLYADSPNAKAQVYAFKPTGLYVWTEGQEGEKTYLKFTPLTTWSSTGYVFESIDQIQSMFDDIMLPLLGSEDVGIMAGDMEKAFGVGGMLSINLIDENHTVIPAYSEEVLSEIENMSILGSNQLFDMDITQDLSSTTFGPIIHQTPSIRLGYGPALRGAFKVPLNMHHMDVEPKETLVATALVTTISNKANDAGNVPILACGLEIVTRAHIWLMNPSLGAQKLVTTEFLQFDLATVWSPDNMGDSDYISKSQIQKSWDDYAQTIMQNVQISKFDWHPYAFYFSVHDFQMANMSADISLYGYIRDDDNYTWLDNDTVRNLHLVRLLSNFKAKDFR